MLAHRGESSANLNYYVFKLLLLLLSSLLVYCYYFKYVVPPHDDNSNLQKDKQPPSPVPNVSASLAWRAVPPQRLTVTKATGRGGPPHTLSPKVRFMLI